MKFIVCIGNPLDFLDDGVTFIGPFKNKAAATQWVVDLNRVSPGMHTTCINEVLPTTHEEWDFSEALVQRIRDAG